MPQEPGKIRNVAVVGHRGTGKTSLVEAMLFQAGKINRLGTVEAGGTVSDWDEDEQKRQMSLAASLAHLDWQGRKINLIDTPGDSGFQADTIASLRVVEGARGVVSGVMGVEVNTTRVWNRAEELELSRVVFVNMLDRERADFYRVLASLQEQLSSSCVAIQLPIGSEHELTGVVDLLHNCAYMDPSGAREGDPVPIPDSMADHAAEYRETLVDAGVETDEELMERYLGGEELDPHAVAAALKTAVTNDDLYPVTCGVATKNLGAHALLDLIVEGVPSPARKPSPIDAEGTTAFIFKTVADPFAGRISAFRVYSGTVAAERARQGQGAPRRADGAPGQGPRARRRVRPGRSRGGREAEGRPDRRRARRPRGRRGPDPEADVLRAGDELRGHAEDEGRRGQGRAGPPAPARGGSDAADPPRP